MKRLLVIAICVLVAALGAACGGGDGGGDAAEIENTVKGFVSAFNARDYDKCLSYATDYGDHDTMVFELGEARLLFGQMTLVSIENLVIQDSVATATVTIKLELGDTDPDSMRFLKKSGSWKIDGSWDPD